MNVFHLIIGCLCRCYWGYCFESLATEDPNRADGDPIHHVDANVEYCTAIKTKLGAHRILMGAEMDCCDSTDDGRRFYVELKTSREVDSFSFCTFFNSEPNFGFANLQVFLILQLDFHTEERYEREKLLKFWVCKEIGDCSTRCFRII